jgi:hypothetical protein
MVQVAFWTQLAGILTALALFLGVVMNIVVSFQNGKKLDTQKDTLADQNVKADAIHTQTAHIEHLVNSGSDELKATIVDLRADAVLSNARVAQLTALTVSLNATIVTLQATIDAFHARPA